MGFKDISFESLSKDTNHWVHHLAMRLAVIYPETWAIQNKQIMQAMKYEYATTRGLEKLKKEELDLAINIWKSQNKYPPKPSDLVEYVRLARDELKRFEEQKYAKTALEPPEDKEMKQRMEATAKKVLQFRNENPNATWIDICRAALSGKFR